MIISEGVREMPAVVGEYIDAGQPARTAGRRQLQRILTDMASLGTSVDYVITVRCEA